MSITHLLPSEEIWLKSSKEYRHDIKERLTEISKDIGSSPDDRKQASKMLMQYFSGSEKKVESLNVKQYEARPRGRQREFIPVLVCKTCGKVSDKVMEYEDAALVSEKRKTWKRTIRPNLNFYIKVSGKKRRSRRIFFAYKMVECIRKKHKLTLRYEDKSIADMGFAYRGK
jgi:hypothetical protein